MPDHEEVSDRLPLRAALLSAGVIVVIFGLATVVSGGRALFGGAGARAAVGDAVPFVLWFNTLAGFAYVAAGVGLLMRRRWAVWLSALVAATTLAVFAAFAVHVLSGGAYEARTVGAMTLRSLVWIAVAMLAWRSIGPEGGR